MNIVKNLKDKIASALGLLKGEADTGKEVFAPVNARANRRHKERWEARQQRKGSRAFNESKRIKLFRLDTIEVQSEILHGERIVNPHMKRNVERAAEFTIKADEKRKRDVERAAARRALQPKHVRKAA